MQSQPQNERNAFVSAKPAGRRELRFAIAGVLASVAMFVAAAPYATIRFAQVPAFIPAYQAALVISDLITAVLLFGQFNFLRSRAVFVLASGYLFTASIAFSHMLTFPGVFSPTGLLGAGPQSSVWLFFFWHGGFPVFVITYALLKDAGRETTGTSRTSRLPHDRTGIAIAAGVAMVLAIACGLTLAATANLDWIAVLILNGQFTQANSVGVAILCVLSMLALVVLWSRRPHTVLDLWLMVVMCAWLFDIALSGIFNATRFDLGWYAGRIYGLLAASFLLVVLLIEYGKQYSRLAHLSVELSAANESLERLSLQDALTGLANRRFFDRYLAEQIAVAHRYKRSLALVLCDVDAFKAYNDSYGHQAGDECLKRIAAAIRSVCRRPADSAARYGGEEFALSLPDTDLAGAVLIAEAARDAVAQLKIPHAHSPTAPHVTISSGVAVLLRTIDMTAEQLLAAADQAMYQAKRLGRNRMVCVPAGHPGVTEPLPELEVAMFPGPETLAAKNDGMAAIKAAARHERHE